MAPTASWVSQGNNSCAEINFPVTTTDQVYSNFQYIKLSMLGRVPRAYKSIIAAQCRFYARGDPCPPDVGPLHHSACAEIHQTPFLSVSCPFPRALLIHGHAQPPEQTFGQRANFSLPENHCLPSDSTFCQVYLIRHLVNNVKLACLFIECQEKTHGKGFFAECFFFTRKTSKFVKCIFFYTR